MWSNELLRKREQDAGSAYPIVLNAWESDYCGDPLIAIVSAISNSIPKSASLTKAPDSRANAEAIKDAANFAVSLANNVVSHFTGLDPIAAGKYAEEQKQSRSQSNSPYDFVRAFDSRQNALKRLKTLIKAALTADRLEAIVMVDELDRCRPNYAIEYLETIKHVFDIRGLTFVLAIDRHQLASSARALYGDGLNFEEYFRKFAHRAVNLPSPSKESRSSLIHHLAQTILEINLASHERASLMHAQNLIQDATQIALSLDMLPRQLHETFRLIGHLMACGAHQRGMIKQCFGSAALLMSALLVRRPEIYIRLGCGMATEDDFRTIISIFPNPQKKLWWGNLIITGYQPHGSINSDMLFMMFLKIGAITKDTVEDKSRLLKFMTGWDSDQIHSDGIRKTFEYLEGLRRYTEPN